MSTNTIEILSLPTQGIAKVMDMSGEGRFIIYLDIFTEQNSNTSWRRDNIRIYDTQTNSSVYVNVSSGGEISNHPGNSNPSISSNGRYAAFWSYGSNLVDNDTNQSADVFVRDILTGVTERVSVSTNGEQGTNHSFGTNISSDGRYVLFDSSSNLAMSENSKKFVYIHDRNTNETKRVTADTQLGNQEFDSNGDYDISTENDYLVFWTGYTLYHRSVIAVFTDTTPPGVYYNVTPEPNSNGWNKNSVNLTWEITDDSVITSQSGCGPQTVSTETTSNGLTYTCSATSRGGTTVKSITIKYDSTAPSISYIRTLPNVNGWNNSDVIVSFNCSDALSRITVCSDPATIKNEGPGQKVTGTAIDNAGNISTVTTTTINIDKSLPNGYFTGDTTVLKLFGQTISGNAIDATSSVARVTLSTGSTNLTSDSSGGLTLSCNAYQVDCTWAADNSLLPRGVNVYTLTITDLADNVFTTSRQYTVL